MAKKTVASFGFEIKNEMLVKPSDGKFSQVRCHILTYITAENIIPNKNFNSLKINAVDRLIQRINQVSF